MRPEAKLKANAEAETFFAALGRILFYSRVHQSLLLDNRRVASVNQAAKQVREGVFHIEPQWLDRASALDQVDDPVKGLAQLAEELKSGIDLLVKSFSQLVGFVDALYQVGSAGLDVGEDVSAYLRKVVRLLRDRMGYERVIALLADAETTTLHSPVVNYEYESPEEAARVQGVRVDWMANRRGVWAWVARNQRELYVADAHADFVEDEHSGERVYISSELVQLFKGNSFLAVPLLSRQQTGGVPKLLGLLSVASLHSDRIRKSDLNVMRAIARQIGLTLENASLHDHLQKQIAEQDRELQKQRQELRESYYRLFRYERNEFHLDLTAGLAHDLKNPLIAGRQYLQVLRMELAGFVKDASAGGEDDQRLIDEFRATAEKYIDKVADVLLKVQERLRDIELRATETEPESNEQLCDVLTALNESLADIPQAMRSGIAFHRSLQEVPPIRSHPDSLRSLFMNLITNAIEAIPKERGGDIWIALRPDGRDIVLTVEDNGRGIPAHDLDKVFQARFTTKPRGTGLGLAWVHRNVTQHLNGRIHAESGNLGDGKRTRFTVRLPTATQGES
ncbi:MAG: HAMP domain-containing sensor histidine kinase [Planctomycetota bacterium]